MTAKQPSKKTNEQTPRPGGAGFPAAIILFAVVFCTFVAIPWSRSAENSLLFSPIKGDLLAGRDYHTAGMDVVRQIGLSEQRVSQLQMEARSAQGDEVTKLRNQIKNKRNAQFDTAKSGLRLLSKAEMSLKRAEEKASLSAADHARLGEALLWQAELLPSMPRVDPMEPIRLRTESKERFEEALKKDPENSEARNGLFVLTDIIPPSQGGNDGHNHDDPASSAASVPIEMPVAPGFGDGLPGRITAGNWWFDEAAARYEHLHGEGTPEERQIIAQMFTNSIEAYEQALAIDSQNPNVLTDCGIMYFYRSQIGDSPDMVMESVTGATSMYNAALAIAPDFPPALYNMVKMYAMIGDMEKIKVFGQRYLNATEEMTDDPNTVNMRSEIQRALAMIATQ